jgi:Amt family ammonium transporter
VWSAPGWLKALGMEDFAGSSVVHMVGGLTALVAAIFLGPRTGRWAGTPESKREFRAHNMAFVVLGTFILWCGLSRLSDAAC